MPITAGGLVFIGETHDHRFRAFDPKTGKVLWEYQLEAGAYPLRSRTRGKTAPSMWRWSPPEAVTTIG